MVKKIVGLKVLILPLAVSFVVMFVVLYLKPAYDTLLKEKKIADESVRELENIRSQNAKLSELKLKWERMEEKNLVQVALPDDEEIDSYMSELYGRVTRSGTLLTKFETAKAVSSEDISYLCKASAETDIAGLPAANAVPTASSASAATSISGAMPVASGSCANLAKVDISAVGNWDQVVGLFRYLQDTNRLANISKISIQSKEQAGQEGGSSDLLSADISLNIFYKKKKEKASADVISSLAGGGRFNDEGLKKLKKIVFSVFEEPGVSESGERNIFK